MTKVRHHKTKNKTTRQDDQRCRREPPMRRANEASQGGGLRKLSLTLGGARAEVSAHATHPAPLQAPILHMARTVGTARPSTDKRSEQRKGGNTTGGKRQAMRGEPVRRRRWNGST